jgi:hypothetical protein
MSRTLSPGFITELTAGKIRPVWLLRATFGPTVLALSSHNRNADYGGDTYLGNSWLQSHSAISESSFGTGGLTVRLTGVPLELTALLLRDATRKDTCRYSLGFMSSSGAILEADTPFIGKFNTSNITRDEKSVEVDLNYDNILLTLQRPRERRWTDAEQKRKYPDDRGFEYIPQVAQWSGFWGKPEANKGSGHFGE